VSGPISTNFAPLRIDGRKKSPSVPRPVIVWSLLDCTAWANVPAHDSDRQKMYFASGYFRKSAAIRCAPAGVPMSLAGDCVWFTTL